MNKRETRKTAAVEFQAWPPETTKKMERDFSADNWSLKPDSAIAVDLRITAILLGKTKADLVDLARSMDVGVFQLIEHLQQTADSLGALVEIVEGARARLATATAVVAMECWGEGGDLR